MDSNAPLAAYYYEGGGQGATPQGGESPTTPPRYVSYSLDKAGNRAGLAGVNENGMAVPFTPNALNQYRKTANPSSACATAGRLARAGGS